jgi:hypothetical protein
MQVSQLMCSTCAALVQDCSASAGWLASDCSDGCSGAADDISDEASVLLVAAVGCALATAISCTSGGCCCPRLVEVCAGPCCPCCRAGTPSAVSSSASWVGTFAGPVVACCAGGDVHTSAACFGRKWSECTRHGESAGATHLRCGWVAAGILARLYSGRNRCCLHGFVCMAGGAVCC